MLNWPLHAPRAHVALKWWILHNPDRPYGERCPAKNIEVHTTEGPILGILPDLDLTRDLKIEILSAY